MMLPRGKGFMIWMISRCENGDAGAIATAARQAGLTHIQIKIANGINPYNYDAKNKIDLVPPVANALKAKGIQVWGWHYVYGDDPVKEAQIAVQRVKQLNLDGYIIDAEVEYKKVGKEAAAKKFMTELHNGIPNIPIALCSYRFPKLHPELPWKAFMEKCDVNMPQVYWEKQHNPGVQLKECVNQFNAMTPILPIIPVGACYKPGTWFPTPADATEFLKTARTLNLEAVSFYEWYYGRNILRPTWDAISAFNYGNPPPPKELPEQYIDALNAHDPNKIASLYDNNAIHVSADSTIQGPDAIRVWYTNFLNKTLPKGVFSLISSTGTGSSRQFTWNASSSAGKVKDGNDTFGIQNGKIAYHSCFFTVTH